MDNPLTVEDDTALIAGVLSRDPVCERLLVDKYTGLIHHILRSFGVNNQDDLNDATQDIFIRILKFLPRWDPTLGVRLGSVIGQITKRHIMGVRDKFLRGVNSQIKFLPDGAWASLPSHWHSPEEALEYKRVFALIEQQVANLTPLQQSVIYDRAVFGITSHAQLAERSGAGVRQTAYALQIARISLKQAIQSGQIAAKPTAQDSRMQGTAFISKLPTLAELPKKSKPRKPKGRPMRRA